MKDSQDGAPQRRGWFSYVLRVSLGLCFCVFTIIGVPKAWSFETAMIPQTRDAQFNAALSAEKAKELVQGPFAQASGTCEAMLQSIQYTPPSSGARSRHSAGQVAALGLVVGLRFALPPTTKYSSSQQYKGIPEPSLDVRWPEPAAGGDSHALMVSAYRRCQKDKALKALHDFRWSH